MVNEFNRNRRYKIKNMSFKKNPTVEELKQEVELLQEQVVNLNSKLNAANKQLKNHPAQKELDYLSVKWWFRFFKWIGL